MEAHETNGHHIEAVRRNLTAISVPSRPDQDFLTGHRLEGSRRAGRTDGSGEAFTSHLIEVESSLTEPVMPHLWHRLHRDMAEAKQEIELIDAREVANDLEITEIETKIQDLLTRRSDGSIVRPWLITTQKVIAAISAFIIFFGLIFFYSTAVYSIVFDPTLLAAIATRNVNVIGDSLSFYVSGVFPSAMKTGGIGLVAFLIAVSLAVQVSGVLFAYQKNRWMVGAVIILDTCLAVVATIRLFAVDLIAPNVLTVSTFTLVAALIVLTAFLTYTAVGKLLRFVSESDPIDSPWHYSKRQLKDLDARKRELMTRIEQDKVLRSDHRLIIARREARLDGYPLNFEVTEAVMATILFGWLQTVRQITTDEEFRVREQDLQSRYSTHLESVRRKYGTRN